MDYEIDERELEREVEKVIADVAPNPATAERPKVVSFWDAFAEKNFGDSNWPSVGGVNLALGIYVSAYVPINFGGLSGLLGIMVGLGVLFVPVLREVRASRKALRDFVSPPAPPMPPAIESLKLVIERQRQALADGKVAFVGTDSKVAQKIVTIRAELEEAKTLRRLFEELQKKDDDPKLDEDMREVEEHIAALQNAVESLERDQNALLEFTREVEASFSDREDAFTKAMLRQRLAKLKGRAESVHEESREVLRDALLPLMKSMLAFNEAGRRLEIRVLSEGETSVQRLIEGAERIDSGVKVEGAVIDIRSKLRA